MPRRDRLDARKRRLSRGLRGADKSFKAGVSRALRRRQRTSHRSESTVERELSDRSVTLEGIRRELTRGGEDRERDRKIESGAFLAQAGGCEIDSDSTRGPLELGRGDPASDTMLRLLASTVGEPDDGKARDAVLEMGLDLDLACIEADQGMGNRAREHRPTLGRKAARVCAEPVSNPRLRASN